MERKFYYVILSKLFKSIKDARQFRRDAIGRGIIPRRVFILNVNGGYKVIRKLYDDEFWGKYEWQWRMTAKLQHKKVLEWLKKKKKEKEE